MDGDESDSYDSDVPLASLGKRKKSAKQETSSSESEVEYEEKTNWSEQSEDDEELSPRKKVRQKQDDSISGDDFIDDASAELENDSDSYKESPSASKSKKSSVSKSGRESAARTSLQKSKPKAKSKMLEKHKDKGKISKTSTKKLSSSGASNANQTHGGGIILASTELYAKCDKGKLIQSFLCRWWYAISWPDPKSIPSKPPPNYDSLDGFPGVFICTSGDEIGKIIDTRDKDTCPNFANFAKKSCSELRDLLILAIEKQKSALIEAEGPGTSTEKELMELLKWAKKINVSKADKNATKVLKAAKLPIP